MQENLNIDNSAATAKLCVCLLRLNIVSKDIINNIGWQMGFYVDIDGRIHLSYAGRYWKTYYVSPYER